jgi:hypothetical protein
MIPESSIKLTFIQRAVERYAKDVIVAMDRKMQKLKTIDTSELRNSLNSQLTDDGSGNVVGKLLFLEYGRFIDMGVGRGHPVGGNTMELQNRILASDGTDRFKKNGPRKAKKIYSPIAYGKLNGLIEDLAYGFTQETIQSIKQELESTSNNYV